MSNVLYCDGSYHSKYDITGIGIVNGEIIEYVELYNIEKYTHEIESLIHAIELGLSMHMKEFTLVNDDESLITSLNKLKNNKEIKSTNLTSSNRFQYLLKLIIENNINVRVPKSDYDLSFILKSHNLSRNYLKKEEYSKYRKANNITIKCKVPTELYVGSITRRNVTDKEKSSMKLFYCALTNYDDTYSINDILKWIEDKPSSNTKNGRRYAVKQFVDVFL